MSQDRDDDDVPAYGTPPPLSTPLLSDVRDGPWSSDARSWKHAPATPQPTTWDEVRSRHLVLAFDGRVLEIFGVQRPGSGPSSQYESVRFHIANIVFQPEGPDRKGRYLVIFRHNEFDPGYRVRFETEEWITVGPFLSRVTAARPERWD